MKLNLQYSLKFELSNIICLNSLERRHLISDDNIRKFKLY